MSPSSTSPPTGTTTTTTNTDEIPPPSTTNPLAAPKIASSLSAACDTVEQPGTNGVKFGTISSVEAYILANAPVQKQSQLQQQQQQSEDASQGPDNSNNNNNNNSTSSSSPTTNVVVVAEEEKHLHMLIYRDSEGRTALHWSLALKNFDLARALLLIAEKMRMTLLSLMSNNTSSSSSSPQDDANNTMTSSVDGCCLWALPPDVNSTTVLATACAVSAPLDLITDLITTATGLQRPISDDALSTSSTNNSKATSTNNTIVHPFISTPDAQGNTCLHLAASRGNIKLVSLLINTYRADPRQQNKRGQTALHRIVARGDSNSVEELIIILRRKYPTEVKKFVNMVDVNGDTALHYASMEENREMGEFLLRNGADRNIKNKSGKEFWQL